MPISNRNRGLTLLEVMIAVTIAAILLTTIYGVFSANSRARSRVEESSREIHRVRVFFDRLSRELRGANWSPNKPGALFVGTNEDNDFQEIAFTTSLGTFAGFSGGDGTIIRYVLEEDSKDKDRKILYRSITERERSDAGEEARYIILSDLAEMRLRFYNKGAWFEKWNSEEEKQLPQLVEITLAVRLGEELLPFSTTVDIPMTTKP